MSRAVPTDGIETRAYLSPNDPEVTSYIARQAADSGADPQVKSQEVLRSLKSPSLPTRAQRDILYRQAFAAKGAGMAEVATDDHSGNMIIERLPQLDASGAVQEQGVVAKFDGTAVSGFDF